jgi:hypothetical protein
MSATNHRTWQTYHVGHFLLTVQLDPVANTTNFQQHKELAQVATHLVDSFNSQRLPATFAMSDPARSTTTSQILRSAVPHDFAISGNDDWLGPQTGRTQFAREFSRRVAQARGAGINLRTFVPRVASVEPHIDLVVKHEFIAVAGLETETRVARANLSPRALHYGVWEIPINGKMPTKSGWFSGGAWPIWRQIRAAAQDAGTFHLLVDAPTISAAGRGGLSNLTWLLRRVANLRDRGLVQVETLRQAAERLSDVPAVKPQQSILRRAA